VDVPAAHSNEYFAAARVVGTSKGQRGELPIDAELIV
jgi:hypothetical protein